MLRYVGRLRLAQDIDTDVQSMLKEVIVAEEEEAAAQLDILKVRAQGASQKFTQNT